MPFNRAFEDFRRDFAGEAGQFDFLAEFGYDILDNATVGTVGTVVQTSQSGSDKGTFIRLHDVEKKAKEEQFIKASFGFDDEDGIQRRFERDTSEFKQIPGAPLSYWVPTELRSLYDSDVVFDASYEDTSGAESLGTIKQGLSTGYDDRFLRSFWEVNSPDWVPFAKGGVDTWVIPKISLVLNWFNDGSELKRYDGSYPRNEDYYFRQAITYNRTKRSGRRFGYLHSESIFSDAGPVIIADSDIWSLLAYTNSRLVTYLMLAQTPERKWEVSYVSKLPWFPDLEDNAELQAMAKEIIGCLLSLRKHEFTSPYYSGPLLLEIVGNNDSLDYHQHPHRDLLDNIPTHGSEASVDKQDTLHEVAISASRYREVIQKTLAESAESIDQEIFEHFEISQEHQDQILQEIALRTIEDPRKEEQYDPEAITEPSEDFPEQVKDLLLHFTLRAVHNTDDGIIPLSTINGKDDLLTHIEEEFKRVWGEHATDRLAEVDEVLGSRSASEEAYPNLRAWLEDDLFEYHVSKFDRTPILWRISSKQLVPDPEGEGFGCLVDYHQLDASIFDRLQNQYLEPRRTHLRERRSAANTRRNDESLSTSERADAAEEYERCESGLEQLSAFEEQLGELAESNPREWPDKNQERAAEAARRVEDFRDRTASRLDTLETLAELEDVDMEDLFSPSFYETVQGNKDEWIDALDDLQAAFEAYAEDGSEPVEAHLYDLFEYYDDLVGSSHYASNGILFMTYYFDQFEDAGQAQIGDAGVSERQRLLSELAVDVDEYTQLAEEISDDCDEFAADIPNDWEERALSEVTTTGYQPVHKHGVAINITPLAEKDIVPEVVEEKVL